MCCWMAPLVDIRVASRFYSSGRCTWVRRRADGEMWASLSALWSLFDRIFGARLRLSTDTQTERESKPVSSPSSLSFLFPFAALPLHTFLLLSHFFLRSQIWQLILICINLHPQGKLTDTIKPLHPLGPQPKLLWLQGMENAKWQIEKVKSLLGGQILTSGFVVTFYSKQRAN